GSGNAAAVWLASGRSLAVLFWVVVGVAVLMFLVSIVRNVMAATLILAGGLKSRILPRQLLANGFNAAAAALLLFWLYSIVPFDFAAVALGMRVAILAALAGVMVVFSRKLTYWHSAWRVSVESVLSNGGSPVEAREEARRNLGSGLEPWDIHLQECLVPDNAAYAGKSLHELAIPSRFGSVVVEVERNGHSIVSPGPQMRLYPGDKLSLLGENAEIEQARAFLESKEGGARFGETFSRVVLEPVAVGKSPRTGKSFIELAIVQETGVRVVGIQRGEQRIINPTGSEVLREGDGLLLMGTLEQVRYFNRWLAGEGEKK
ncbi:MAG: TrkA C-terminal domain-containing protein, partial [Puniceicoccales bacterium]|nr:TrkA C-terminal domain-containing protein [Puniceicoccales bacterium]